MHSIVKIISKIVFHKPLLSSSPKVSFLSFFIKLWHYLGGFSKDQQIISKISGALNSPQKFLLFIDAYGQNKISERLASSTKCCKTFYLFSDTFFYVQLIFCYIQLKYTYFFIIFDEHYFISKISMHWCSSKKFIYSNHFSMEFCFFILLNKKYDLSSS